MTDFPVAPLTGVFARSVENEISREGTQFGGNRRRHYERHDALTNDARVMSSGRQLLTKVAALSRI